MDKQVQVNPNLLQKISLSRNQAHSSLIKNILVPSRKLWESLQPNTTVTHRITKSLFPPFNGLLKGTSIRRSSRSSIQSRNKRRPTFKSVSCSISKWKADRQDITKQADFSSKYEKELITNYFKMIHEENKASKEKVLKKTQVPRAQSAEKKRDVLSFKRANCMLFKYKKVVYLKPQKDTYVYQSAFPFKVSKIYLRPKSVAV